MREFPIVIRATMLIASIVSTVFAGLVSPPAAAQSKSAPGAQKPYVVIAAGVTARVGQEFTAKVVFKPAAGWHLHVEYPVALKVTSSPQGLTLIKANQARSDATLSNAEGSFEVKATASKAGRFTITGDLRFACATETTAEPQTARVEIVVDVK